MTQKKIVIMSTTLMQTVQLGINPDSSNNIEIDALAPTTQDSLVIGELITDAIRKLDSLGLDRFSLVLQFNYRDTANE